MLTYPDFERAFDELMKNEGGYVDHPDDPGGETNWGISKRSYPKVDIKNLTKEQAQLIYYRDFWVKIDYFLSYAIAFEAFDAAVNHGIRRSIKLLQEAAGTEPDGIVGPKSRIAFREISENDMLLRFAAYRLRFYTNCAGWGTFGKGWVNRVAQNLINDSNHNAEDV